MPTVVGFQWAGFSINAEDNAVFPIIFGAALNGEQANFVVTPIATKRRCLSCLGQAGEQQDQHWDHPNALPPFVKAGQFLEPERTSGFPDKMYGFSIEFTIIHDC